MSSRIAYFVNQYPAVSHSFIRREIRALEKQGFEILRRAARMGQPGVIMEAMALHRPVITTYVAGIPELVRPGENGWLVPAGSVDALAAAMEDCLTRPVDQLRAMGEAGHARVRERHSLTVQAQKLAALLQSRPAL